MSTGFPGSVDRLLKNQGTVMRLHSHFTAAWLLLLLLLCHFQWKNNVAQNQLRNTELENTQTHTVRLLSLTSFLLLLLQSLLLAC